MKSGFIHVCFIIDKSGSMCMSTNDVIGGFKSVIQEQKANTKGECAISLYTFDSSVRKEYIGVDVNKISEDLDYRPGGCTAMNDGIGQAITEIGKWLSDMKEEDRPEKNLIVIMTDGEENSSREYSVEQIKNMIKEQTEKYSWSFIYMGTDITDASYANSIGVQSAYGSRGMMKNNYATINAVTTAYRSSDADIHTKNLAFCATMDSYVASSNKQFEEEIGRKITGL